MKVLFDAFWWARGPIANRSVMMELVHAWARIFPNDEIILAVRRRDHDVYNYPQSVKVVQSRLYPQAAFNMLALSWFSRKLSVDLVVAHNFAPILGRSNVFIHDLMFEDHPEWFTRKERLYFNLMGRLARFAKVITTSSTTEAARITRLHPSLPQVVAVGLAPSRALVGATPARPTNIGGFDNFVLTVGRLNERKNLATILMAAAASSSITPDHPLLIVGSGSHSGLPPTFPRGAKRAVESGRIHFLGHVSDSELNWLMRHADALVFLSRDEGFGLPSAEARAFGLPIIASDIAIMREICPPGTRFVDVDDVDGLVETLDTVVQRPQNSTRGNSVESVTQSWNDIARAMRDAATLSK